ncbi:putative nucleolar MIF4G domain-containing protein 1 [Monocercomonoides exilis]|uniref:putative nucleolar MIF4G domain-containing protein 1 n=1 Tax=Monocercomonoides exilis TaxID=2049356 RepID=UPI003559B725|nr:putative nucleolar MIF4G domain-containing protein 1 [Monocercomonoides exilis]
MLHSEALDPQLTEAVKKVRGCLNRATPETFHMFVPDLMWVIETLPTSSLTENITPVVLKFSTQSQTSLRMVAMACGVFALVPIVKNAVSHLVASHLMETLCNEIISMITDEKLSSSAEDRLTRAQQLCVIVGSLYSYGLISSEIVSDLMKAIIDPNLIPGTDSTRHHFRPLFQRGANCSMLLALVQSSWWRISRETTVISQVAALFVNALNSSRLDDSIKSSPIDADDAARGRFTSETLYSIFSPLASSASSTRSSSFGEGTVKMEGSEGALSSIMAMSKRKLSKEKQSALTTGVAEDIRRVHEYILAAVGYAITPSSSSTPSSSRQKQARASSGALRPLSALEESALSVSLAAVLDTEKKGRWWLVGSAWEKQNYDMEKVSIGSGKTEEEKKGENKKRKSKVKSKEEKITEETSEDQEGNEDDEHRSSLLKSKKMGVESSESHEAGSSADMSSFIHQLARSLRLSTAGRRAILAATVLATDCDDAAERIIRLGLKGSNAFDIPFVLLECCAQEAEWNPFYAHTGVRLCNSHRSHLRSFTNCLRDTLREIVSSSLSSSTSSAIPPDRLRRILHSARFAAILISEGHVGISFLTLSVTAESEAEKLDEEDNSRSNDLTRSLPLTIPQTKEAELFVEMCLASLAAYRPIDGAIEAIQRLSGINENMAAKKKKKKPQKKYKKVGEDDYDEYEIDEELDAEDEEEEKEKLRRMSEQMKRVKSWLQMMVREGVLKKKRQLADLIVRMDASWRDSEGDASKAMNEDDEVFGKKIKRKKNDNSLNTSSVKQLVQNAITQIEDGLEAMEMK